MTTYWLRNSASRITSSHQATSSFFGNTAEEVSSNSAFIFSDEVHFLLNCDNSIRFSFRALSFHCRADKIIN